MARKPKCDCWGNQCCDICTGYAKYIKKHGHKPKDKRPKSAEERKDSTK